MHGTHHVSDEYGEKIVHLLPIAPSIESMSSHRSLRPALKSTQSSMESLRRLRKRRIRNITMIMSVLAIMVIGGVLIWQQNYLRVKAMTIMTRPQAKTAATRPSSVLQELQRSFDRKMLESWNQPGSHEKPGLKNLVIVTGHGVQSCTNNPNINTTIQFVDSSCWSFDPYYNDTLTIQSFIEHARLGVEEAAKDQNSLLIFTGAKTSKNAGPISEAVSYYAMAERLDWFGLKALLGDRVTVEQYAKDSLENLLMSLCRFYQVTGRYPEQITVVGMSFKEGRFRDLHAKALKIPADRFRYIGSDFLNTPARPIIDYAYDLFKKDPFGCMVELMNKKLSRNWYQQYQRYDEVCPELGPFLRACFSPEAELEANQLTFPSQTTIF